MPGMPFLHATKRAKKGLLIALVVPGAVLAFAPWLWTTIVGVAVLIVAVFFASAFAWEREFPSTGDTTG